ncbi:MAG: hypothetical protein Q8P67_09335 [archaeon]|nr:hypothetical protein [archaeon]
MRLTWVLFLLSREKRKEKERKKKKKRERKKNGVLYFEKINENELKKIDFF